MKFITLHTEKLIHGGQALGHAGGKACFVWNALPGEEVTAWVLNEKSNYLEAQASEIKKSAPERIAPLEPHFLACAPWQILSWEAENRWKTQIALETYTRLGKLKDPALAPIVFNPDGIYGYRNKIEYGFLLRKESGLPQAPGFGIHQRGTQDLYPVESCALARPEVNEAARAILEWLKTSGIPFKTLRRLVVKSNEQGQTLAALYVTERCPLPAGLSPALHTVAGLHIYLQSGDARGAERELWQAGQSSLTLRLLETPLECGPQSFFQVNRPVFEMALRDIAAFLTPQDHVVDYYAGVGAISLPLAKYFASAILVENHSESAAFAQKNIKANGLTHCRLEKGRAERSAQWIEPERVLIFDPPRAGLEAVLLHKVLAQKPLRLIYLSCDIATQARDLARLSASYRVRTLKLYNFFPRTPHIEALAVLDRI